jgi:hypothetical protein
VSHYQGKLKKINAGKTHAYHMGIDRRMLSTFHDRSSTEIKVSPQKDYATLYTAKPST